MTAKGVLIALTAAAALIAAACGSKTTHGTPPEERSPGEVAFRASCQTCHALPKPTAKTDDEWPEVVRRYGSRARLSEETMARITSYLVASN